MIRWKRSQQLNHRLSTIALGLALAGMSATGALTGCAGQGDIDRTQPDKVDKAIFFNADGTAKLFYYRPTIVEVPPTSAVSFEGMMGGLEKIRFEITKDWLLGYRAYDYVPGSQNAITGGVNNRDTPVIGFPIKSHFDVKRDYNPGTGEQTNVISENSSDRVWNQRQYMRLDWSPVSDTDINSQYRPVVTKDYIEVTDKPVVSPDFTACAAFNTMFDDSSWDCGNQEIKLRYSFMAVKPTNYTAMEYPDRQPLLDDAGKPIQLIQGWYPCTSEVINQSGGKFSGADCAPAAVDQFSKFGYFRTVRQNYDRKVGATEANRKYLINRWNIWGPEVDKLNSDGKVMVKDGKPVKRRSIKPVVYYTNVEWPDDPQLLQTAKDVTNDWNQAMRETVAALELTEENTGHAVDAGELAMHLAETNQYTKIDDAVVLRDNTCNVANVQKHAGKYPDLKELVETRSPVGFGTDRVKLSNLDKTNLVQACSVLSAATEQLDDKDPKKFEWQRNGDIRYSFFHWVDRPQVGGPLGFGPSSTDPETGEIISAGLYNYGAALDTYAQMAADTVDLLNGEISVDDLLSGKTIMDVLQSTSAQREARDAKQLGPEAIAYVQAMAQPNDKNRLVPISPGASATKLEALKGTLVERLMMTNDILPAILPPNSKAALSMETLSPDELESARPANWLTQKARDKRRDQFTRLATNGCAYKAEFADDAIIGLALELKRQGLSKDEMFKKLRASIFRGLAGHEMGHTMGLRHNFSGSTDALNYQDNYWKIRTTMPKSEWGRNKAPEFQYSTVMDYGARFNSDVHGLGKYDHAAIRFGYGQLIDLMPAATAQDATGIVLQNFIFWNDYGKLPEVVGGVENLRDGAIARYSTINENLRKKYLELPPEGGGFNSQERPYKFCSDEFVGSLDCKPWDMGANQTEIVNNTIDQFRNYYLFNAYKRGRLTWSINGYMSRLTDRYFARFSEAFQYYYYLAGANPNYDLPNDLLKASVDSLNALGNVLQTPEPGMHCTTQNSPDVLVVPASRGVNACTSSGPTMNIDLPDGKPYYIDFTDGYYYRITRAGSLYEKLAALIALTTTEARFFRVDTFADSNRYSINYYRVFKDQMLNLLSGVIRNDPMTYAGYIDGGRFTNTPVVDTDILGKVKFDMPNYMLPTAKRVDTPVNKTIRYYAMGLALSQLDSTWDSTLDISNFLTVTQKGALDDTTFAGEVREFTHPESGITYRAPKFSDRSLGIGVEAINELNVMTGQPGVAGTLPSRFGSVFNRYEDGTSTQTPIPTWHAGKAALEAARTSGDQAEYTRALNAFQTVQNLMAFRVDLLNDMRTFRRAFGY